MTEPGAVNWPAAYTDPETGARHGWDDEVPDDGGYDDGAHSEPYTYRALAYDQAAAQGMEINEYLNHLRAREDPLWDEPDGISPPWVNDGDGYGE